jgi:hypothetical protein
MLQFVASFRYILPSSFKIFSGEKGQLRIQTPTASCIAMASAGAAPLVAISLMDLAP